MPFIAPLFEPVRAVDDATRAFVDTSALDVAAVWPPAGGTCLPAIQALCAFSAYVVE